MFVAILWLSPIIFLLNNCKGKTFSFTEEPSLDFSVLTTRSKKGVESEAMCAYHCTHTVGCFGFSMVLSEEQCFLAFSLTHLTYRQPGTATSAGEVRSYVLPDYRMNTTLARGK